MVKKLMVPALFVGFLVFVVYSTLQLRVVSCYVCIEFRGRTECASASGRTQEAAADAAVHHGGVVGEDPGRPFEEGERGQRLVVGRVLVEVGIVGAHRRRLISGVSGTDPTRHLPPVQRRFRGSLVPTSESPFFRRNFKGMHHDTAFP